mgnify:CR=1 FL=1
MFVVTFIVGSILGSFLNLCAARWFVGGSCCWPRSTCPDCHQPLRWYDLIPIINQVWLRQRCRFCQRPLALDWPLETCAGLLAASGLILPLFWQPYWWLLCGFYYLFAVMDLRQHAILLTPFLVGSSVCILLHCGYYHQPLHVLSALFSAGIFYSFASLTHSFGAGDCDFLVLQCGLFGWQIGLQILALACTLCLLTYCLLHRYLPRQIPFIPYLATATLGCLYYQLIPL